VTLRFRELEPTTLHAGLGVSLIDDYTQDQAFGPRQIYLDIDDGGGVWRELSVDVLRRATTAGGVTWFPWLERYRDARGRPPRNYRVRVVADYYTPSYQYTDDGVVVTVYPFDDVTPPAVSTGPVVIHLLPAASYPLDPNVPVIRGAITNIFGDRVPNTFVSWVDVRPSPPAPVVPLVTDLVLTDADGEFALPMRRAPVAVQVELYARRPPPPGPPGPSRTVMVTLPADLSTFQNIMIL
jgi:hypothetical protein